MTYGTLLKASVAALALTTTTALAEGELNIFSWGNYTPPYLIEKFELAYDVKVTVTEYDSSDAAMAKVKAGGHGFDVVVPTHSFVPLWISEGLIEESRPDQMENFANVDPQWVDVDWDPGRRYTVPYQWGTTGILVHTGTYDGDINTSSVIFDTPGALKGQINVVPEMQDVMNIAIFYYGGEQCTEDLDLLRKVRDGMTQAKKDWIGIDYPAFEKFINEDILGSIFWNGASMRIRTDNDKFAYGYPKEGYPVWQDVVAVLADARNPENARLYQNFIMAPENAALISNFARYSNGILGSEEFMDPDLIGAPELVIPDDLVSAGHFTKLCAPETQELYTRIWTEIQK
ncbi:MULTISPECIES: extracellular solute-binding protein [Roseobacteraceae]|uniref:Spermidine-binding periplasmic protein SpuE n=1 Tax=Pseudosulfitobacter pseudonitzschiae TaxID=1402135 RepID=A0A221JYS1_9RHOB|nr:MULTISPECIES: extracellular solute-binding protein [Roseobacteraceae]ASM71727.1 spermidine-binding periplasmic protein SpuE [Pseudosulfitobacter pseudonitzschiae]